MSGLYVGRLLTEESHDRLSNWWSSLDTGYPLESHPHVTVAHSKVRPKNFFPLDTDVSAAPLRIDMLGDDHAVVLHLDAPELTKRWNELREAGATWDYPSYNPHLTLFYLSPEDAAAADTWTWSGLPLPLFNLEFAPERVGPLDRDVFAKLAVAAARLVGAARKGVDLAAGVGNSIRGLLAKFNPHHDELGRFTSGPGGGGLPKGFSPGRPTSSTPSTPGYAYHATNEEGLDSILTSKKLKIFGPSHGTDQHEWPDGSRERRAYLTNKAEVAYSFAPEHGKAVLLRVREADYPLGREAYTGDRFTNKPIPSDKLEVMDEKGNWVPLKGVVEEVKKSPLDGLDLGVRIRGLLAKFNPHHDELGRFSSGPSGGFKAAGVTVSGLRVGEEVKNRGSIESSLTDYRVLPGVREVPMSSFQSTSKEDNFYATDDRLRVMNLAEQIKASGRIDPLIVVVDDKGPYVLEGGHRLSALHELGVEALPAIVVEEPNAKYSKQGATLDPQVGIEQAVEWANRPLGTNEYYHAVRYPSELDSIISQGLLPGRSGKVFASKDEIRNRGAGYVVFEAPSPPEEGWDVVEPGSKFREFRFEGAIPPEYIRQVVRAVDVPGTDGHSILETDLVRWVASHPDSNEELPRGYDKLRKFNPHHDDKGRFASGPGVSAGGAKVYRVSSVASAPAKIAERLKELRIPPGWRNIELSMDPNARVLAKGVDEKGRIVSKRSASAMEEAAAEKFERLKQFNKVRPGIVQAAVSDLKSEDPETRANATALLLLDRTGFRPGSDRDTKAEVKAYGATTLEAEHVKVEGLTLTFSFTGKKGVTINKTLRDPLLAEALGERIQRGGKIFPETNEVKLRAYLKSKGGAKFKLKDFRTWTGTAEAMRKVKELPKPRTSAEYKRYQKLVAQHVSKVLGNTPTIALKSYIDPAVFARWDKVA